MNVAVNFSKFQGMATNKPQVLAYLHPVVYERLAEFKDQHDIQSLSRAVEVALCDYFAIKAQGVLLPVGLEISKGCIHKSDNTLEAKVAVLSLKYEYLATH